MIRRRAWMLAAAALGACAGDPEPESETRSCEAQHDFPGAYDRRIDILFVVDTSPAMQPHRERLLSNLGRWATVLAQIEGGLPDLRIGVVSSDLGGEHGDCTEDGDAAALTAGPHVDGCTPPDGDFLQDEVGLWYTCSDAPGARCGPVNYEAPLGDTLACMAAVPAGACPVRQPLAAAAAALDAAPDLLRDGAFLLIVIVAAGDDASPAPVATYVDALRARVDAPGQLLTAAVAPAGAARLEALDALVPQRHVAVSIDGEDWSDALFVVAQLFRTVLGLPCLRGIDLTDLDEDNPGIQPECVVSDRDTGAPIAPCAMAAPGLPAPDTARPCWWIDPDGKWCSPLVDLGVEGESVAGTSWRCACE